MIMLMPMKIILIAMMTVTVDVCAGDTIIKKNNNKII